MEAGATNRDLDRRMALPAYYVVVWCLSAAMPRTDDSAACVRVRTADSVAVWLFVAAVTLAWLVVRARNNRSPPKAAATYAFDVCFGLALVAMFALNVAQLARIARCHDARQLAATVLIDAPLPLVAAAAAVGFALHRVWRTAVLVARHAFPSVWARLAGRPAARDDGAQYRRAPGAAADDAADDAFVIGE